MKKIVLFVVCGCLTILTGCWDRIDIENRAYVLGVAIDKYPPIPQTDQQSKSETSEGEEEKFETMELHTGEPMYAMTVQVPIIKKANFSVPTAAGGSGGGGGGEASRTWDVTQVGNSFFEMNRELASRMSFIPYYEHLQTIILSEEVAAQGIKDVLDFFVRDPEMRRRTKVFISPGYAKSILDVTPRIEDYPSVYLAKIPLNSSVSAKIIYRTDLGEAVQNIQAGLDFILPKVEGTKDELKVSKAIVFKGDKMVGELSELEIEALKMIRGNYKGGVITTQNPDDAKGIIALEVTKVKSKIVPEVNGQKAGFTVNLNIQGNYAENINMDGYQKIDNEYLEEAEKAFSTYIEQQCVDTVKRVQRDFNADIFQFNNILKTQKPAYWKQVQERWYDIFPGINVQIKAKVTIRQVGNSR